MTRTLNTLFTAAVLFTGIATATAAFAAEGTSTSQQPHGQVVMAQMGPDQMAQMPTTTTDGSNAPTAPVHNRQGKHPGGTGSR
jgi:hypothetical protein